MSDVQNSLPFVEKVLEAYRGIILARMELPYRVGQSDIISLIIEVDTDQLGSVTGKLGMIEGVKVKSILL